MHVATCAAFSENPRSGPSLSKTHPRASAARTTAEGVVRRRTSAGARAATRAADDQKRVERSHEDRPARVFAVTATVSATRRARRRDVGGGAAGEGVVLLLSPGGNRPQAPETAPRRGRRDTRASIAAARAGGRCEQAAAKTVTGGCPLGVDDGRHRACDDGRFEAERGGHAADASRRTQRDAFVGLFRPDGRARSANRVDDDGGARARSRDGGRARRVARSSRDRSNRDVARSRDGGDEARARRRARRARRRRGGRRRSAAVTHANAPAAEFRLSSARERSRASRRRRRGGPPA